MLFKIIPYLRVSTMQVLVMHYSFPVFLRITHCKDSDKIMRIKLSPKTADDASNIFQLP